MLRHMFTTTTIPQQMINNHHLRTGHKSSTIDQQKLVIQQHVWVDFISLSLVVGPRKKKINRVIRPPCSEIGISRDFRSISLPMAGGSNNEIISIPLWGTCDKPFQGLTAHLYKDPEVILHNTARTCIALGWAWVLLGLGLWFTLKKFCREVIEL